MRYGIWGDKESPDIVSYWDDVGFNELGVGRTGFYTIFEFLITEKTVSTIHLLPYTIIR